MKNRKIKLSFSEDIPHLTYRTLSVLYKHNAPIILMEVYAYVCYINLHPVTDEVWESIKKDLSNIDGWESIEEIDLFPFEEKDTEMKNVLDIIPHGVILINKKGDIKYINNYVAEKIFFTNGKDIKGVNIRKYINDYDKLLASLRKSNSRKPMVTEEIEIGNQLYSANLQVIRNDEYVATGFLMSLYDIDRSNVFNRYDNPITFDDIIGESNKMIDAINQGKLYSKSDSPVLITGESGTGKELFARAIHNESSRKDKPFIAINCAAIPDQLLESELFGYEPGTFTGGIKEGKAGIFEIAHKGTVFLDEIGEMPPHLQAKLLRVLQEKKVRRVGGSKEIPFDVRLITATNRNIDEMVKAKEFRLDLLFRINIFNINIPPLRERKEDIPILFEHFTRIYSERYNKHIDGIEQNAMRKLINYNWPGNVREFQNVLERAIALATKREISAKDIILNYSLVPDSGLIDNSLTKSIENLEKKMIVESLKTSNSIREAARNLQVTHTLLINRMKKYGINKDKLDV
ncbi:sigma-54 interaction domain-containing protein [Lutispora thermophila]|uniref:HTH-type transcriptional regulatory protein TyrR n=1 Tax=Lutispora thermophila DSM 19022 TaxID=1122184 RepID=A0A1M6H4U9_9FIRM|nr:sigma 54-interacting transcriptional regulator [Lutispora thermophila]SHJ17223.1 transcriptional regulator of aroF, aroG, tyrA and aromatic amino acid transport [Lutispora thermophila DSM 19022]